MSVKRYEWVACDEHSCHCDVVESAEGDMVDYEDYAALEARCAALASENARMKAAIPQQRNVEFDNDNMDDVSLAEDFGFNDAIGRMRVAVSETPATDAFLAEVRAQGVDMFSASLKVVGGHEHPYSAVANEFAAQLRKGVQS